MFGFGPMEIAVVGIVGLLLFGNKLPATARSLGSSIIEFKRGLKGLEEHDEKRINGETE